MRSGLGGLGLLRDGGREGDGAAGEHRQLQPGRSDKRS
jgi:hypothetical protein